MATFNYTVFKQQIVAEVENATKKAEELSEKNEDNSQLTLQIQNMQLQANCYCMMVRDAITKGNMLLNEQLAYPWKSASRCLKYINDKAKEFYIKGSNAPVMVDDKTVLSWLLEYYSLDDKEQVEKEMEEAEEKERLAREKAEKKKLAEERKAIKTEKDLKKAATLIEKMFSFHYKPKDSEKEFLEKMRKNGYLDYKEGVYSIHTSSPTEDEDEPDDFDEESEEDFDDLDFVS